MVALAAGATQRDIKEVELQIERLRSELIKWVVGTGVATVVAMMSPLKYVIH